MPADPPPAEDARQIHHVVQLYGIAVDTRDFALFEMVFTPDARLDYFDHHWSDRASFTRDFDAAHRVYDRTQHMMTSHLASARGDDAATALTYCDWRLVRERRAYWGVAWYHDALVKTADGWRIAARRCELLWSDGDPTVSAAGVAPVPVPLHVYFAAGFPGPADE